MLDRTTSHPAGDGNLALVLVRETVLKMPGAARDRRPGEWAQIGSARHPGRCLRHPMAADGQGRRALWRAGGVGGGHDMAFGVVVVPQRPGRAGPWPPA